MLGAEVAILYVGAVLWLKETLPASLLRLSTGAAPFLLTAVLVPAAFLTVHHAQRHGENAAENAAFMAQLRQSVRKTDEEGDLWGGKTPSVSGALTE
jgi:hypothetical protein